MRKQSLRNMTYANQSPEEKNNSSVIWGFINGFVVGAALGVPVMAVVVITYWVL